MKKQGFSPNVTVSISFHAHIMDLSLAKEYPHLPFKICLKKKHEMRRKLTTNIRKLSKVKSVDSEKTSSCSH